MKLSILILTHNRPELFKRCLESVLNILPENVDEVEVLVNNDSNDITKIIHNQVKYFNYKDNDLSNIYKFLFNEASGDYIYYLEDDDYLNVHFFKAIDYSYDINFFTFISTDIRDTLKIGSIEEIPIKNTLFQLSQILFKKNLVHNFPQGNHLDNDWKLFQDIRDKGTIKLIKYFAFTQTTDGKDNISFKKYNKDIRWNI